MAETRLRVPGLTLSRQFTFSVGYTILPHRAQLGFMAPGKAGAGTPELARVLFPRGELAGDCRGCNYTSGGGGESWGTGLRLRPPSPNKHSGEEGLRGAGTRRGRGQGRARPGALPGRPGAARRRVRGRAGLWAWGASLGETQGSWRPGAPKLEAPCRDPGFAQSPSRTEGATEPVWLDI